MIHDTFEKKTVVIQNNVIHNKDCELRRTTIFLDVKLLIQLIFDVLQFFGSEHSNID